MASIASDSATCKFPHVGAKAKLLDQVAIGQVTPGNWAMFIIYLLQGGSAPLRLCPRREIALLDEVNLVGLRNMAIIVQYRFLHGGHSHYRINSVRLGVTPVFLPGLTIARGLLALRVRFGPSPNERASASPATTPFARVSLSTRLRS